VLINAYPQVFDDDPALVDRVLRAFVTTVIRPRPPRRRLTRAFTDPIIPLLHTPVLCGDLARRGQGATARPSSASLRKPGRRRGRRPAADETSRKLYSGAIALAQIAFYAGIYDAARAARIIGFEGADHWHPLADITYPIPRGSSPGR